MKLRRTSFLLSGSLLAATLLTSLGCSEPEPYQEPQVHSLNQGPKTQSSDQEAPNKPLQPSPEVIAAWKKAGARFSPVAQGVPEFSFFHPPTRKFNALPPQRFLLACVFHS